MSFPGADNSLFVQLNPQLLCPFEELQLCNLQQNCSQNNDCKYEGENHGCAKDIGLFGDITTCRDTSEGLKWLKITEIAVPAAIILLALHVIINYYIRLKNEIASIKRRRKKNRNARVMEALNIEDAIIAADEDDEYEMKGEYEVLDSGGNVTKKRWSQALVESEKMHMKYKADAISCLERSHDIISAIRRNAAIMKIDTQVMSNKSLQVATMYRIVCLAFLKEGSLLRVPKNDIRNILEGMELCADKLERALRGKINKAEKLLGTVEKIILDATVQLKEHVSYHGNHFDIHWDLYDPQFQKFQAQVYKQLHPEDSYHAMQGLILSRGIASTKSLTGDIVKEAKRKVRIVDIFQRVAAGFVPGWFRHFATFYLCFFGGAFIVGGSFIVKTYRSNQELENGGLHGTFLPVPGYYDVNDGNRPMQRLVPFIYGVMHMALYFLCWIPVPMTRGLLRDISLAFPQLRTAVPIDDAYFFHKVVGMSLLSCLAIGATIFVQVTGQDCVSVGNEGDSNACFAFDQIAPANIVPNNFSINPVQNVYMLRKIVWMTWFTIFPMLHWSNNVPKFVPGPIQRYWYEIWYYLHHIIAHVSIVLALIARFEVFFPAISTWGVYYLDKFREKTMKTAKSEIIVRPVFVSDEENPDDAQSSTIHLDDKNQPNSMRLLIEVPPEFKVNAGQWIYLKVPAISRVQWHPFSLASASRDTFVELHVGIRGRKSQWKKTKDKDDPWEMARNPTWTYKLYKELRKRIVKMAVIEDPESERNLPSPLFCQIRGPYGSTFTKCFDPHYYASTIIGAGTGLTSAESVLREIFWRKRQKARVPKYTWFIWSCQRVDDLLWMWSSLHKLLFQAVKDGILKPGAKWNEQSLMMDWLGIYFYVSRADKERLDTFINKTNAIEGSEEESEGDIDEDLEGGTARIEAGGNGRLGNPKLLKSSINKKLVTLDEKTGIHDLIADSTKDELLSNRIHNWMGNSRRLFLGSMDDPEIHIEKVFAWSRLFVDRKAGKHKKMALCFCGPPGLAHTLDRASNKVGNTNSMEFSADHQ